MVGQGIMQKGFTMIEMLVTLIIVGILAGLAAPAFTSFIAGQNIRAASSMLQSSLLFARSEALKRNADVIVSPVGGQWASGWTVAVSATAEALSNNNKVSHAVVAGPASITYNNAGRISSGGATFKFSSTQSGDIRCLNIGLSGMPTITTSGC